MSQALLSVEVKDGESVPVPEGVDEPVDFSPFDLIPNEILEKILQNLSVKDKKSASLVSSRFCAVVHRELRFSIPLTNATLYDFEIKDYKLNELKVLLNKLTIPDEFTPRMTQTFKTAKSLNITTDEDTEDELKSSLDNGFKPMLLLGDSTVIDGNGIQRLLTTCDQIETLRFDFKFLSNYSLTGRLDVSQVRLEHLRTLQIKLARLGPIEMAVLNLETPGLRRLEVEQDFFGLRTNEDSLILTLVLQCITRNVSKLRELKLVRTFAEAHTTEPQLHQNDEIFEQLAKLNLESFEIHHIFTDKFNSNLASRFFTNLRALKTLKIHTDCNHMMSMLVNVMFRNFKTLTTLELNLQPRITAFHMEQLNVLPHLTTLSFTYGERAWYAHFPGTVQHLTWNNPISWQWYAPEQARLQFQNLVSLTLRLEALKSLTLKPLCDSLFGIKVQRTRLESITFQFKPMQLNVATIQFQIQDLPKRVYQTELNEENLRITRV